MPSPHIADASQPGANLPHRSFYRPITKQPSLTTLNIGLLIQTIGFFPQISIPSNERTSAESVLFSVCVRALAGLGWVGLG